MMICTCCQQDSAGNHTRGCPNNPNHSELSELTRLRADLLASQEELAATKKLLNIFKGAITKGNEDASCADRLAASQLECERLREALQAFDAAYPDIRQLQHGFMHSGGPESWSDWDKQVEQTTIAVGEKVHSALAITTPILLLEYQRLRHDALYYRAFRAMRMKQSKIAGGFWEKAIGGDTEKFDRAMLADYEFTDALTEQEALSAPPSPDALAAHDTALLHKAAEKLTNVDHESCQTKFDVKHACVDVLLNTAVEREPKP